MPMEFTAMPDGRLVVADMGHRSYQLFAANGEFDRMVGMGGDGVIRIGALAPHPSGDAVLASKPEIRVMPSRPAPRPLSPGLRSRLSPRHHPPS